MTSPLSLADGREHRPAPAAPAAPAGLSWLAWLRVAAIVGVVLIHTAGLTAVAPDARSTVEGRLGIVLTFSFRWVVPMFVMLSGALLLDPARYRGPRDFLRRRAIRLVPAVVVWHLVYLLYVLLFTSRDLTVDGAARLILTGRLWTALYFFWIVLGLAVVTPVLVPWVASATRRAQLLVGLAAAAVPALTLVTVPLRQADLIWVETPWTWWMPYLGYYLLGYALRDRVLRGAPLALAALVAVGGSALLGWHWRRSSGVAGWLEHHAPAESYYSPTLVPIVLAVFLLARSLVRSDGLLRVLCRPDLAHLGRRLSEVSLGVFAVHLLVLEATLRLPLIGGDRVADSVGQLVARCLFVLVVAFLIALVGSRLPGLRRVF